MRDLTFSQPERRSFLIPLGVALAAAVLVMASAMHFFPATSVNVIDLHTDVVPTLTVYKSRAVIGNAENNAVLFIASQIRVENQMRVPVYLDDFHLTLTEPDDRELTVEGVRQPDLMDLGTNFPALKPLLAEPLLREAVIAPKQAAQGTIVFPLKITKELWQQRKSAVIKIELYHQPAVYVTVPK